MYLYDRSAGTAQRLDVVTHGGSTAFANPTATSLHDPSGRSGVMATLFLPVEGAAPGEAGRFFTTCRPTSHVRQPEYG